MRRVRILRVITRLNVGGPALNAALLSARLDPDRFETLLVAGTEKASEGSMLELGRLGEGLNLRRVPALGREISPLDDLRAFMTITKIAREFRPDIVHTHLAKAGTIGRIAGRLARARAVVHTYHGTVFRGYFGRATSRTFLQIERGQARSRLGLPPNKPVVAIVARLVPIKNVSLFLRAMVSVSSAVALVVGD